MVPASHKITEFPGNPEAPEPLVALRTDFLTQDRDPTREIRNLIDELESAAREARRRQRHAEEECEQLRGKLRAAEERSDSALDQSAQIKALTRERDMLLSQQTQYGPAISDLKQRLKVTESHAREVENKVADATRQRDAAARQRDVLKDERDKALDREAQAKRQFAEAQKALGEARQELAGIKKRGDVELAAQLESVRQARDGMSAQVRQLTDRVNQLDDELAEANYAREAAEKLARDRQAQVAEIQTVLDATASGDEMNEIAQLEVAMLELRNQLAGAEEKNRALSENEARLASDMAAMRAEMQTSLSGSTGNSALLEDAHASLVAAQKQIEATALERDALKEQLARNANALEARLNEQSVEIERLREALRNSGGRTAEISQNETQHEQRRLDMIELNTRLENAHREIRILSASLAEARLQAKLATRSAAQAAADKPEAAEKGSPLVPEEILAMRRAFQAFSRDQKQIGLLGEMETHTLKIAHQAVQDGRPVLNHVCTAFASLLNDLLEVPDQISQSTVRTLNQGIEFVALLISDPESENHVKLDEARVYVLDDDANTCADAVDALNLVGIKANHGLSSSAAIIELASNPYDLIFLDVHLPELSGFEVSTQIRNMSLHAETPIFFVTGDTSLETRVKSSLRGGAEFIAKPFSVQEIALKSLKTVITGQLRKR